MAKLPRPFRAIIWERLRLSVRIDPDYLKCVVFVGVEADTGAFTPTGTGFLIVHAYDKDSNFLFLATAAHLFDGLSEESQNRMAIRLNRRDGGVSVIKLATQGPTYAHSDPQIGRGSRLTSSTLKLHYSASVTPTGESGRW